MADFNTTPVPVADSVPEGSWVYENSSPITTFPSHQSTEGDQSSTRLDATSSESKSQLRSPDPQTSLSDWAGRGTSHVAFAKEETLPLLQGRFLGYGVQGGVYETTIKTIPVAWKRKFCRYKIGARELQEIEIIRRLDHQHIIKLVGTYTHGPFLGLLLWPVAKCDLATFLEDVDLVVRVRGGSVEDIMEGDQIPASERLTSLGFDISQDPAELMSALTRRLEETLGCLTSAIVYLHAQKIRHKDLKPSNILLSPDGGLFVSDFGTSTDFSARTESASQGGDRGTPKYFAPEVAAYESNGRAADIFSLGCIFLEVIGLSVGYSLEELRQLLRPEKDGSFQGNLTKIFEWFNYGRIISRAPTDEYLFGLVRCMVRLEPSERRTAEQVESELEMIGGFRKSFLWPNSPFRGRCCTSVLEDVKPVVGGEEGLVEISVGNRYWFQPPYTHKWVFFVRPSFSFEGIIEKIPVYKHCSFNRPTTVLTSPPFELNGGGWGSFDISVYVVLKSGYEWLEDEARPIPGQREKRMLPLSWGLNFMSPESQHSRVVKVRKIQDRNNLPGFQMPNEAEYGQPSSHRVQSRVEESAQASAEKGHKRSHSIGDFFSRRNSIFGSKSGLAPQAKPEGYPPMGLDQSSKRSMVVLEPTRGERESSEEIL